MLALRHKAQLYCASIVWMENMITKLKYLLLKKLQLVPLKEYNKLVKQNETILEVNNFLTFEIYKKLNQKNHSK